ncbi:MAG: repressor LexA [Candidatus Portnoybacteria bacterium RBG_19FT_COMBO_36_7]|uniref:Repressor LexA n=1 Tax=Candidatus Portnoybacteria bacterium RBG_19FT_COMBO_36_7 TaxID=1801992 RepID=A0A1G2F6U5_9BACT|nr:MAG: repressor LexA [Candidatus Portnoybacteria bacterium RBG_19FT_COMBO_36_7]
MRDINLQFEKIISFWKKHKRMPSYSEILRETGLKSKNAAFKLVGKLIDAGFIDKDGTGHILPTKYFNEAEPRTEDLWSFGTGVKVLGLVEAGIPALAEQQQLDTITLDEFLIRNRKETYLLEVSGDSMIDAGILPRDLVLVERGKTPKPGDIVIAQVDGNWTIKYLRKKGNKLYLEPANKKFRPIFPKNELFIAAVVQAVIRKYR